MALTTRDTILVVGSTMRLTRLVVTDDLGNWMVKWPAYRWASRVDPNGQHWQGKTVLGLDCPFCVGTWIGFGVLAITQLTAPTSLPGRAWRFVMAGLSLNYVTAHLGSRIDVPAEELEED